MSATPQELEALHEAHARWLDLMDRYKAAVDQTLPGSKVDEESVFQLVKYLHAAYSDFIAAAEHLRLQ